jgi:outer membrane protein OmpA-like peptidoglycan-associated protein
MISAGNETNFNEKKGRYWKLRYIIKTSEGELDRNATRENIIQVFKEYINRKNGRVRYEKKNKLTFTIPTKSTPIWCYLIAGYGSYNIHIVEYVSIKPKVQLQAKDIKKALENTGRISVYGINFDIGKASLQPGADETLMEMVKLLKNNPNLKLEIQGHTDNTGTAEKNLELSIQRAETVKDFLIRQGIDEIRLTANGFGSSQPVDTNDSEEGRAKNRRVELVRKN